MTAASGVDDDGPAFLVPNLRRVHRQPRIERCRPRRREATQPSPIIVENAKPARAFLKSLAPERPLTEIIITELGPDPAGARLAELLAPARAGAYVGLLSDAGCPGIADPGAAVVAAAHESGVAVVPLVGPSAILLALMASGMNGQGFTFHGYLPVPAAARAQAIRALEAESHAPVTRSSSSRRRIATPR
jgi:16S rRNA (cytidine1402-2'-O)-methyltransferase